MINEKRLIDANDIVKVAEHAYNEWNLAMAAADGQRQINLVYKMKELCKAVKAVADAAPTMDAVEVVRCKDCKYWDKRDFKNNGICLQKKNPIFFMTPPDFYCACGERREGE